MNFRNFSILNKTLNKQIFNFSTKCLNHNNNNNINKILTTNICYSKNFFLKSKFEYQFLTKRFNSVTPGPPKKKNNYFQITWKSVIISGVFGTAFLLYMWKLKKDKEEMLRKKRLQTVGKMAIGGPFELVNTEGKTVKNEDFKGNWLLIYFGFTRCPDVCPEEIEKLLKAVDLIEKVDLKKGKVIPVFISVDPERDDVNSISKYVKEFSPKLIGLTGSKEQIDKVTKAYRVYFSQGPKDEEKDYIVDHTIITYLVNPRGEFVDYYGQNKKAEDLATAVAIHMTTWDLNQN